MTQQPPADGMPPPEEPSEHAPAAVQSLKQAMRRARFDDAERVGAIADLRAARITRLQVLEDALAPLTAQIPRDIDIFDFGLMPGANPRLFVDMIGFVEMGRDARRYRFLQDTRHGRTLIAESDDVDTIVDAITQYVARRMLERDKALAAEPNGHANGDARPARAGADAPAAARPRLSRWRRTTHVAGIAFAFVIDLLGAITFFAIVFAILGAVAWLLWNRLYPAS